MPDFGSGSDPNAPGNVAPVSMGIWHPDFCGGIINPGGTYSAAGAVTASLIHYIPFIIHRTITIYRGFFAVGATVSGNYDMGIYNEAGTRLTSIGTTAVPAGANIHKLVDFADVTLTPGRYYLGIVFDTAATMLVGKVIPIGGPSNASSNPTGAGMMQQAATFPLPATATFAIPGTTMDFPWCGILSRATP